MQPKDMCQLCKNALMIWLREEHSDRGCYYEPMGDICLVKFAEFILLINKTHGQLPVAFNEEV